MYNILTCNKTKTSINVQNSLVATLVQTEQSDSVLSLDLVRYSSCRRSGTQQTCNNVKRKAVQQDIQAVRDFGF